jgi:NAD(P)-dependent dehydrogenase (short-subunit alcohol dehydrogenase family)
MAIALVTGTSSGIGLATAVTLARGGHTVIATMRNLDGGDELRQIVSAEKLPVTVTALNVDDDDSVSNAIDKVLGEYGRIEVLVNNAGVIGQGSVEELPVAVFRQVMETNFFGGLRCIKARDTGNARTSSWLHHQCDLGLRPCGSGSTRIICGLQVGF